MARPPQPLFRAARTFRLGRRMLRGALTRVPKGLQVLEMAGTPGERLRLVILTLLRTRREQPGAVPVAQPRPRRPSHPLAISWRWRSDVGGSSRRRRDSSSSRARPPGRCGTAYPDMTWEPRESFRAVADY